MGYFNEIGLQSFGSQPMLSSQAKELLLSIVLCGTCFAAAVLIWKGRLTTHKGGPITLWLAYVYVISIFAMAYFRFQAVQAIVPNL
jgi:hypothetical protein